MTALFWLLACKPGTPCEQDADCTLGEMCFDRVCTEVVCVSSADCAVGDHCTAERTCEAGCESSSDCFPGDSCIDQVCTPGECSDTVTDCGWREQCNEGSCEDAGEEHCAVCSDDTPCADGSVCWSGFCGVRCDSREDCPGGFDCADVTPGSVQTKVCVSACWLYE